MPIPKDMALLALRTGLRSRARRLRELLPTGRTLNDVAWEKRHRGIRILLIVHAAALPIFGMVRGHGPIHVLLEASVIAGCAAAAGPRVRRRDVKEGIATFGLITASALLVHLSGGSIEAHFHFFVMVIVIALYQDWTPFLLTLAFVVVHHGVLGVIGPRSVYNHPAAWSSPWKWALIHGVFVLGASAASLVSWRLDEKVRRAEQTTASQLAATLESTADGIVVVDGGENIALYNQTFVQMWGIPDGMLDDPPGDALIALIVERLEDADGFLERASRLIETDETSFEIVRFRDGRVFECYSRPRHVDGRTAGRVWSFRDITERSRLDEMKNSFLSAISHELRTPLSAVLGYASTLRHYGEGLDSELRNDIVERIEGSAVKLNRLLADTLDLDRLMRGIIDPIRTPTDIGRLLRSTIEGCEALGSRHVAVAGGKFVAAIDAAKVERIVENLLINCARHTPDHTPIWARAEIDDGALLIVVEDAGPGVPDTLKEFVFQPFRQGDVPAHSPGVGIGLSLVARFAELHGGRAWVQDRPGGGASFRVRIPTPNEASASVA